MNMKYKQRYCNNKTNHIWHFVYLFPLIIYKLFDSSSYFFLYEYVALKHIQSIQITREIWHYEIKPKLIFSCRFFNSMNSMKNIHDFLIFIISRLLVQFQINPNNNFKFIKKYFSIMKFVFKYISVQIQDLLVQIKNLQLWIYQDLY